MGWIKAKKQPESQIQANVYAYLQQCPEYFGFAVHNGGVYDPRIRGYRANRGVGRRKGIADLIGAWSGQLFCVEVKTSVGRLSPEQKAFRDDVVRAGGLYVMVRSVEEVVDWVRSMRFVAVKSMIRVQEEK